MSVELQPPLDLGLHLGRERAQVLVREHAQQLDGQRQRLLIAVEAGAPLWGARYSGPPHVVFGHNAMAEVQVQSDATGLDTGAVYGNRLTARVLPAGSPPPPRDREEVLVSVASARRYADD